MNAILQNYYGTTEEWENENPRLYIGVWAFEFTTEADGSHKLLIKIGDGAHRWNLLPYMDEKNLKNLPEHLAAIENVAAQHGGSITALQEGLQNHEADKGNPHEVTKAQVGLGDADNTSDEDKPVSAAQQAALDEIAGGLDSHEADKENPHEVTKAQVGLGDADNTSDEGKPVSAAQQAALDEKLDIDDFDQAHDAKIDKAAAGSNGMLLQGVSVKESETSAVVVVRQSVSVQTPGGAIESEMPLPMASGTRAGIMPAESFAQIDDNTQRIEGLEGRAIHYSVALASDTPSQPDLQDAYEGASGKTGAPGDQTTLDDTAFNKSYTYYESIPEWVDRGATTIPPFSNSTSGTIKGDDADGKVFAESNGTGSVVGWTALKSRVADAENAIPGPPSANPQPPGNASAGTENKYARSDHVHPAQSVVPPDGSVTDAKIGSRTLNGGADTGAISDTTDTLGNLLNLIWGKIKGLFSFFNSGVLKVANGGTGNNNVVAERQRLFTSNAALTHLVGYSGGTVANGSERSVAEFLNDNALRNYYGVINTQSSMAAKQTSIDNFPAGVPPDGIVIMLRWAYGNINNYATLTINDGSAYPIYANNAQMTAFTSPATNTIPPYIFDGANQRWLQVGVAADNNTTYSTITQAEIDAGTVNSSRLMTPKLLVDNFAKKATRYMTKVVGLADRGYTAKDVDYLIPSGTTDCSTIINQALASITAGKVLLLEGNYPITSPIYIEDADPVSIAGLGMNATIIDTSQSASTFAYAILAYALGSSVEDLAINASKLSGAAIQMAAYGNGAVRRVRIYNPAALMSACIGMSAGESDSLLSGLSEKT